MSTPITTDQLVLTILAVLAVLLIWGLGSLLVAPLVGRALSDQREQDAQVAADFREPTRSSIENAYGPLVLYGPSGEAYDGTVDLPRRGRSA